jgi:hypothetical protein
MREGGVRGGDVKRRKRWRTGKNYWPSAAFLSVSVATPTAPETYTQTRNVQLEI